MLARAATIILIISGFGALSFGAFVEIRGEIRELRNPSPERLTAKFFGACVTLQNYSPSTKEAGITTQQIKAYCRCYAESLVALTTIDERHGFALEADPPQEFQIKVQQAANQCIPAIGVR